MSVKWQDSCLSSSDEEPVRKKLHVHFPNEESSTYSTSYIPSDHSSSSSAVSSNLTTIIRDVDDNDLTRVFWPSQNQWYSCFYRRLAPENSSLTPAMLEGISAAMSVHSRQSSYKVLTEIIVFALLILYLLLQPSCPLFLNRIEEHEEFVGRGYQWHNGNGKGYFSTLFRVLLNGSASYPRECLM